MSFTGISAASSNRAPEPLKPSLELSAERILIIDDTREIHEDFRKILTKTATKELDAVQDALFGPGSLVHKQPHFVLDSAYQGEEGVDCLRKSLSEGLRYALAFVDIRMPPGWDGVETVSRLWGIDPELQIVLCTAYSDYSWDELSKRLGMTDNLVILKKPFDNIEVLQLAHALTTKWLLTQKLNQRLAHSP
ncbi:MAG: hypothetical protein U1G07_05715 [Verrucomicrobiota bacterium]